MSRVRDIANILSGGSSAIATDAEITSATAYIPENVAGKNFIINGGQDIWQRNTSYSMTSSWAYGAADRWGYQQYPTGGSCTVTRSTDVPTGAQYSLKMQRTASSTNTSSMGMLQCIESMQAIALQGKTVTLSFWAKAGANFSGGSINAKIQTGTVADETLGMANGSYTGNVIAGNTSPAITTTWTRYTLTTTLNSNIKEISININWAGTGTAGADDSVYVSNVQLEIGSVATPFSRAGGDIQGELAKCQRYYFRMGGDSAYQRYGTGYAFSTTRQYIVVNFPTTMRIPPNSLDYLNLSVNLGGAGGDYLASSATIDQSSKHTAALNVFISAVGSANMPNQLGSQNTLNSYLGLSAEL